MNEALYTKHSSELTSLKATPAFAGGILVLVFGHTVINKSEFVARVEELKLQNASSVKIEIAKSTRCHPGRSFIKHPTSEIFLGG